MFIERYDLKSLSTVNPRCVQNEYICVWTPHCARLLAIAYACAATVSCSLLRELEASSIRSTVKSLCMSSSVSVNILLSFAYTERHTVCGASVPDDVSTGICCFESDMLLRTDAHNVCIAFSYDDRCAAYPEIFLCRCILFTAESPLFSPRAKYTWLVT